MPDSRNSVLDDIISPEQPVENGSQSATTSVGASGDQGIDGQLSGIRWASLAISYSFPDALSDYGYSVPGFSPLSITQRDTVQRVLEGTGTPAYAGFSVEGLTNLDISYRGYGTGTGTLRYANTGENTTAYAYYPSSSIYGGDSWYAGSGTNPAEGNYHYHTIMHETGHALGLKHGHETSLYGSLPAGTNSMEFSVMTYSSYVGSNNAAYYNESWGFSQTYMMYDIAALQYMYGANYSSNSGNTVYSWNPNNGTTYVDGATAISPGANRVFETIWDGGGTDTYDLSNYATDLRIDLAPGGYSLLSSAQRAYLGNGNYARGNVFNALLHDDDLRSIIENAIGGSGADSISGNIVQNLLDGGAGNDTLAGLEGADRLLGRDGADSLLGGAGNDMLDGGAGQDTLDGGTGSDTALYTDRTTSVRVDLSAGQASFPGTSAEVDTLVSIENAQGGADNDTFIGNGSDNSFSGNAGNDIFYGTGGGADIFDGGSGTDVMFFQASTAPVRVDLGQGVVSFPGQSLPNQTVISIENVQAGSGNDTLLGNASNNLLSGNAGNDSLSGGAGNDSLYGSAGNDTLDGGGGRDLLDGGEGIDTVLYTSSTTAVRIDLQAGTATVGGQSGTETLSLLENAQTGSGADTLLGTSGANELQGGGGADHLTGRGGADRLVGGAGNDVFHFLANDSTPAARDVIAAGGGATAFQGAGAAAGDRFDLSAYDADTTKAGIQDWLFGTAKTKGHLWMTTSGSQTILNGNNDNDAAIEFQVAIDDGNIAASAYKVQDFIL